MGGGPIRRFIAQSRTSYQLSQLVFRLGPPRNGASPLIDSVGVEVKSAQFSQSIV
jgi:hypothetical protein